MKIFSQAGKGGGGCWLGTGGLGDPLASDIGRLHLNFLMGKSHHEKLLKSVKSLSSWHQPSTRSFSSINYFHPA